MRDLYEVPAAEMILTAHKELEKLVGTIHQNRFKPALDEQWAFLVYAGLWYEPLLENLNAFMDSVNEQVTGKITLQLYRGKLQGGAARVAERAVRPGARELRRVGRAVLPAVEPGLHRALDAPVADGLRDPEPQEMKVEAVSRGTSHGIGKAARTPSGWSPGLGVEGDVHAGAKVKHRSRVRKDPDQPNLRQVHLIHAELHEELAGQGFEVAAGRDGRERDHERRRAPGAARRARGCGSGREAVVEVKGLRNPCSQLDEIAPGLMKAVLDRDADGELVHKAGVMGVVLEGGEVRPGDPIEVELPAEPHVRLAPV